MNQPVILCGLGRIGRRVMEYLHAAGISAVVIDTECSIDDPRLLGARLVRGDCRRAEVLKEAGLEIARGVLILTSNDLVNISAALTIRQLHKEIRIVTRMFNQNLIARLGQAVHNVFALSTSQLTAPLIALTATTGQALGTFRIEGLTDGRRQVAEVTVDEASALCGLTVGQLSIQGREAVAHFPASGPEQWLTQIDRSRALSVGDHVVLCGEPKSLEPLLAEGGESSATGVQWAGWLRRQGRVLKRTLLEIDKPVKICAAVLVSVILVSTLVFHFGVQKDYPSDAFFRTISIMATGGDMHGDDFKSTPGLKVFAATLRILGAALTAAFTAIVTNYLLRARLGGALEVRRIPESGHIVLCGLGSVGFRVLEELVSQGERVVAVEIAPGSRFIATARRLGAAVITGDATVPEVLRQAHGATAKAVIAATSDEIRNLEIALLVRSIHPKKRVVLRLADADLARMLRESADVRLAVSVSTLAAPAFVAALFGDRVLSVFMLRGRMVAAIDLWIGAQDASLVDQAVRAVAVDYQLLPVAVLKNGGQVSTTPMNARLSGGDRLIALIALGDLQKLLRRDPPDRSCRVEVLAYPLPARDWLVTLLRTRQSLAGEEAANRVGQAPFVLEKDLSRGQAEDLLALLGREKIMAKIISNENGEGKKEK